VCRRSNRNTLVTVTVTITVVGSRSAEDTKAVVAC